MTHPSTSVSPSPVPINTGDDMIDPTKEEKTTWADPGFFDQQSRGRSFWKLIKSMFTPAEGHRTVPTTAGVILLMLIIAIGTAAYNTANNILFITLSLLFSCLLLSGFLSWLNFKGCRWRLVLEPHFRAMEPTPIKVELENTKKMLPTYSLWFNLRAVAGKQKTRLYLGERLDPLTRIRLDWLYEPQKRGVETITLSGIESQYPFGFLQKTVGANRDHQVAVWPARTDYTFHPPSGKNGRQRGNTQRKPGQGSELINLRNYTPGDPQRSVHWKASARMQRLMVRQTSEEQQEAYLMFIETPIHRWVNDEQFEKLCSFAASLAEDLYMEDRLWGVAINDSEPRPIRRVNDLHTFLSDLARLEPVKHYKPVAEVVGTTFITFQPGTGTNVTAYVGGNASGQA